MTQTLFIGDYTYSSWSLRGWLLFERFGLSVPKQVVDFNKATVAEQMAAYAPARTVPTWVTPEGIAISESLAIAEELATRHPDAGHWPTDPAARAVARTLTSEMHAGFGTLRSQCPMNLRDAFLDVPVDADLRADLDRINVIWEDARNRFGQDGPWLCGTYSVADAFYAPVAARIAGYGLPVGEVAQAYVAAHLNDLAFRRWRAMGFAQGAVLERYEQTYAKTNWPGPKALAAKPVDTGTPENDACPYSGKEITHLLELDGRIFGFCNAFCRDKTVADPEAWPAFKALL